MRVVILGATGRTGTYLVQQALAAGHEVTAFVRDPQKLESTAPKVRVAVGDARDKEDLTKALEGQDAIISAIGSDQPGSDLITTSTKALIETMHKQGVRRIIMMSSFLASPSFKQSGASKIVQWLGKPLIKDKLSGEDILKQSDLDWTIVYATRLDGAKPGGYRVLSDGETVGANDAIARADVADFLIKQIGNKDSYRKSLVITSK